jgi:serine/threonine-protein kinase
VQAESASRSLLPRGRTIGARYEIEAVLGEGASGVVYVARCKGEGGRKVALKVIHRHLCSNRQIYKRFQREAEILKRLEGPHLVKLLEFLQEDDLLFIALEYVEGKSLEAMLAERAPIDLADAVEIALQICAALGAAHAAGVVHRDLKPANVLIENPTPEQPGLKVRVVDFGLAKVVHGEQMSTGLTEQDMIFGTPEYMAPEQARGDEVDPRCDIYTAGVMLYEMAVGEVPFRKRSPIASMTAHLTEEPPPPRSSKPDRGISPSLETVILRALAKSPADRYPNARAFAEALASARDEPRVIAVRRDSDESIAESDTDLHVTTSSLEHSPTLPADEAMEPRPPRTSKPDLGFAETELAAPASSARWMWTIVAVIALAIGVTIGVLVGTR